MLMQLGIANESSRATFACKGLSGGAFLRVTGLDLLTLLSSLEAIRGVVLVNLVYVMRFQVF